MVLVDLVLPVAVMFMTQVCPSWISWVNFHHRRHVILFVLRLSFICDFFAFIGYWAFLQWFSSYGPLL